MVHLVEELHVRLFALTLVLLGASGAVSVLLAQTDPREHVGVLAVLFAALAILSSVLGLARRRPLYRWLRHNRAHQLAPALIAATIVLADGPYSPSWWIALALLFTVAAVSDTRFTLAGAILTALAYTAGTLLRGASLLPGGDGEYLTVIGGLIVNPLIALAVAETFARFVLRLHRLQQDIAEDRLPPLHVTAVTAPTQAGEPPAEQPAARPRRRLALPRGTSTLTARQLEVVLLARDGLRQAEIAACLGISARQVERHLEQARRRAKAATTSQLVAMLVSGRLVSAADE
jgi:DNA-binding CsgD family transcriptional regulator